MGALTAPVNSLREKSTFYPHHSLPVPPTPYNVLSGKAIRPLQEIILALVAVGVLGTQPLRKTQSCRRWGVGWFTSRGSQTATEHVNPSSVYCGLALTGTT